MTTDPDPVRALIREKCAKYLDDMEGADYDDFIKAEWAHGAMCQLLIEYDELKRRMKP